MPFAGIAGGSSWVFVVAEWGFEKVCNSSNRASSAFSGRWLLSGVLTESPPMTSDPTRVPEEGCPTKHTFKHRKFTSTNDHFVPLNFWSKKPTNF
jgi:hypothetical protein